MNGTRLNQSAAPRPPPLQQQQQPPPQGFDVRRLDIPESNQARAARYEDEKRRIIESCFNKKEADGVLLESYITHVRIQEDAAYPTTPPPPDSAPSNKKPRLILIAVRKSGRVRVHKARENASGTFSIGKTWALDELSHIHMFTGSSPTTEQERMEKIWAGETGFIVTLGKPYYWSAQTAKEKDFFIASLIKIYRKYTGGQVPKLTGFLPHQLDQLTGGQIQRSTAGSALQPASLLPSTLQSSTPPTIPAISDQRLYSPVPQKSFQPSQSAGLDYRPPPLRLEQRPYIQDGYAATTPDPLHPPASLVPKPPRSPARLATHMQSRENIRQGSALDKSATTQSQQEPASPTSSLLPLAATTKQPFYLAALSDNQTQSSLTASSHDNSRTSVAEQRDAEVPQTGDLTSRSLASSQLSDRPTTARSDDTTASTRPTTAQESLRRLRPSIPQSDANGVRDGLNSSSGSAFVTPLSTPNADRVDATASTTALQGTPKQGFSPSKNDYFGETTSRTGRTSTTGSQATTNSVVPSISTTSTKITPVPTIAKNVEPVSASDISSPKVSGLPESPLTSGRRIEVANKFRKAATAVNAFKPREGGGAARLRAMQEEAKKSNEPDGITGVVPAPLLRGMSMDSVGAAGPVTPSTPMFAPAGDGATMTPPSAATQVQPETTLADIGTTSVQPQSSTNYNKLSMSHTDAPTESRSTDPVRPATPERPRSRSPQRRKRQRQEIEMNKYCSSLGVDATLLQGRGADFNDLLTELGWDGRLAGKRKVDDLEADIRREIGRAQAMGWLGHVEQQETKVQELSKAFDRAIEECEELDGLFTLYAHELDTLQADIEYIEAQSQGLQVQTANQKLLYNELQNLLNTLTISKNDLRDLEFSPFDSGRDIVNIERALVKLYSALTTIDPDLYSNKLKQLQGRTSQANRLGVYTDQDIGQMRAVREKKDLYRHESREFILRFGDYMRAIFKQLDLNHDDQNKRSSSSTSLSMSRQGQRQELWLYHAMMLFVREVDSDQWNQLIHNYDSVGKGVSQGQFRDLAMAHRREARKPASDEQEILFTFQEKEKHDNSLTHSAARKITVKRGKTIKTTSLKQTLGDRREGKNEAWEAFLNTLQQQAQVVAEEQNFLVQFFHLSSQSNSDFVELVSSKAPEERRPPNLSVKQSYEPDRNLAAVVEGSVGNIYSFWASDLSNAMDWVLSLDQLQGVGVLFALETVLASYEDTNQEFIGKTLRGLHERLVGLFHRFVEDQVRAIEETKVKVKKRKGIIALMRTFPLFSMAVESMLPTDVAGHETLEVRFIVNDAYNKLLRAMWESLTFIAKEDPQSGTVHTTAAAGGDPEDKQLLNHHILLIENMNHYIEETETHENVVLEEWRNRANHDLLSHLTQYTDAVMRRPLGKWLDFVESTEAIMKSQADSSTSIASRPSHSRSACKKILKAYDTSEIRKGIETLRKRIDKHFTDAEDPGAVAASRGLIVKVNDECYTRYVRAHERMQNVIDKVYDGSLEIDWRKEEVAAMFRKGV